MIILGNPTPPQFDSKVVYMGPNSYQVEISDLDAVGLLVTEPPCPNSATRQNLPNCDSSHYNAYKLYVEQL